MAVKGFHAPGKNTAEINVKPLREQQSHLVGYVQDVQMYLQSAETNSALAADTFRLIASISPLLRWFGDPILRQVCPPLNVEKELDDAKLIADQLTTILLYIRGTMGLGRGLSAPQIGISKRIFVALVEEKIIVFVNPKITCFSESHGSYPEMCLSGLPLAGDVVRPWEIEVEYYDIIGKRQFIRPDSVLSRIIQHEVDHLDGTLFTDRAEPNSFRFVFDFDDFKTTSNLVKID